jgi:hypothetical protein
MREFEPSLRGSIRKCAEGDDYGPRSHHRSVGVAYSNFHTHIDGGVRCGRPGLVNARPLLQLAQSLENKSGLGLADCSVA